MLKRRNYVCASVTYDHVQAQSLCTNRQELGARSQPVRITFSRPTFKLSDAGFVLYHRGIVRVILTWVRCAFGIMAMCHPRD